jgi:hypothetical protein
MHAAGRVFECPLPARTRHVPDERASAACFPGQPDGRSPACARRRKAAWRGMKVGPPGCGPGAGGARGKRKRRRKGRDAARAVPPGGFLRLFRAAGASPLRRRPCRGTRRRGMPGRGRSRTRGGPARLPGERRRTGTCRGRAAPDVLWLRPAGRRGHSGAGEARRCGSRRHAPGDGLARTPSAFARTLARAPLAPTGPGELPCARRPPAAS